MTGQNQRRNRNLNIEPLEERQVLTRFFDFGATGVPDIVQDAGPTVVLELHQSDVTFTQAEHGQVAIDDSGDLVYTPDAGFVGKDEFTYTIGDGQQQTVDLTVWESLYAVPDWFQVAPGSGAQSLDVVSNDYVFSEPSDTAYDYLWFDSGLSWRNQTENLTIIQASANGTGSVSIVDNSLSYTPTAGFSGEESLTYVIEDELGHRSEATVTVEVSVESNREKFISEAEFMQSQVDEWMRHRAGGLDANHGFSFSFDIGDLILRPTVLPFAATDVGDSGSSFGTVRNVQDGDIVKSNGDFLYYVTNEVSQFDWFRLTDDTFAAEEVENLHDSYLTIVDVSDAANPVVASSVGFDERISNLFLDGDRIALLNEDNGITVMDVADPAAPTIVYEAEVSGYHNEAQLVDGHLYVISNHRAVDLPIASELIDETTVATSPAPFIDALLANGPEVILPNIIAGDSNGGITTLVQWSDLPREGQSSISSIATFDIFGNSANPVDLEMIAASRGVGSVYFSSNAIYVQAASSIHKFDFESDGSGVDFAAKGDLPDVGYGWFSQDLSMNEHEGRLQIATHGAFGSTSVDIHVMEQMGSSLNVVGSLSDIAPGEQIYSTHFAGDRAYVVTYEKVDPFFVIDLSDPTSPSITGELKVPGYSNYLLPISDDLVIGIGRNADPETGLFSELQVSLFGVSDPANPTLIDRFAFEGGRSTWSALTEVPVGPAGGNGVTFDPENGTLALPIHSRSGWSWSRGDNVEQIFTGENSAVSLFHVDASGIESIGQVEFDDKALRTVLVDDHLVYMSGDSVKVAERATPSATVATLELPKTTRDIEAEVKYDMNDDGVTNPLDVLLMINQANSSGFGDMSTVASDMHQNGQDDMAIKIDVNNDGEFSPVDPLMVINSLNSTSTSTAQAALSASTDDVAVVVESAERAQPAETEESNEAQVENDASIAGPVATDTQPVQPLQQAPFDLVFAEADDDESPTWRTMSFLDLS